MESSKLIKKRAQIWGIDLFIAATLFSIGLLFLFLYSMNSGGEAEGTLESLRYEGGAVSNALLSEGYPVDWNSTNVVQVGILTNGKVNDTKLQKFYDFSITDYYTLKRKLNTPYDFYFFFDENMTIGGNNVDGIGKSGFNRYSSSQQNLIRISRITIYNEKVVGATLYIWS